MLKIREFDLSIKKVGDKGFSGYASTWETVDSYGERIAPGAFAASLSEAEEKGRRFPVLFMHDQGQPIGTWTKLEEDETGLYGEAELWVDDSQTARIAHRGIRDRSLSGLSIGFYPKTHEFDQETGIRTLTQVQLVEASVVVTPANDDARIDVIKAKMAHGALPDLPEFERFLREAGFSRTQAAVVANRGLAHLLRSESEAPATVTPDALVEALKGFELPKL